jgi:glycosyltransferase involved in cell wall biosynthesis
VGFVGRLTTDKGLPELLAGLEAVFRVEPSAHLLLVGWFDAAEDALNQELRTRILRHPRIDCTGFVTNTAPYYRAMDVLVLPTWREGFPNVALEAAASGVPVVTTQCTGARDSVVSEVTGMLIPPGYPEAITEAVLKIIRDPERKRRMGVAARAWILEHYLESRVLALTADFYRSLVSSTALVTHYPSVPRTRTNGRRLSSR